MKTNHISYGIIPVYKSKDDFYILCVKNQKSGQWGLPKGTPEKNETSIETAKRELREETGIKNIKICGGKTFQEKYSFEEGGITHNKTNIYYFGFVDEMIDKQDNLDEIDETQWIKIEEAENFFVFQNIIDLTKELHQYLLKFPMVNEYNGRSGETYLFEYFETDSIDHLPQDKMSQVQIMAFHKDKLLIVNNANKFNTYSPVGGSIEKGEKPEECLVRELREESNMRPIIYRLIGYQKCTNLSHPNKSIEYQLRYAALVEPIGPFTPDCDPDGDVTELLEINPVEYKKYFDWGKAGEIIMKKAIEFYYDRSVLDL
jgi:bis(5'-nucleosidyl)-tetraphosphatase